VISKIYKPLFKLTACPLLILPTNTDFPLVSYTASCALALKPLIIAAFAVDEIWILPSVDT